MSWIRARLVALTPTPLARRSDQGICDGAAGPSPSAAKRGRAKHRPHAGRLQGSVRRASGGGAEAWAACAHGRMQVPHLVGCRAPRPGPLPAGLGAAAARQHMGFRIMRGLGF